MFVCLFVCMFVCRPLQLFACFVMELRLQCCGGLGGQGFRASVKDVVKSTLRFTWLHNVLVNAQRRKGILRLGGVEPQNALQT